MGAEAGFRLLWLIVLGCAIKVAAQIEIGRTALTWGRTPLAAFDAVPGPRLAGRGWIFWGWALMTVLIVVQQGASSWVWPRRWPPACRCQRRAWRRSASSGSGPPN